MDAVTEAPLNPAEPTNVFPDDVTTGPSWTAGHLARVRGLGRKLPPDEIDREMWLKGYDCPPMDFCGSPPMPGEAICRGDMGEPSGKIRGPRPDAGDGSATSAFEDELPEPVIPLWAKEIHPRSLIAPRFVIEDPEAEQILEVWRHNGLLTVVGKPSFDRDDAAAVMVYLLEGVACYIECRCRELSLPLVVEGAWSRVLQSHFERVRTAINARPSVALTHLESRALRLRPIPNWADDLHPRSLIAPTYLLSDHNAEQLVAVWRHRGFLTVVGKPNYIADRDVWFMVHQLDNQNRFIDALQGTRLRAESCPLIATGVLASQRCALA